MKLYNSLTRKKEELIPLVDGKITIYSCGQTIYRDVHIGNARTYSYWDVLVRYLRWRGYDVFWVMNITDVGHLTDDADAGEDKIVKEAKNRNLEPMVLLEKQIKRFFDDLDHLNIQRADIYPRATGHLLEMIEFVKDLLEKGHAYEINGTVYFDVNSFPGYGSLSPASHNGESAGRRIAVNPEKRDPRDFALWLRAPTEHLMKWPSPWGPGYPGWHIECSVMSQKYLGETIDIHTGGIEHLSIHHPNEIAQSEARTGKKFVNYWLHARHLTVNGEKMGKSLGNTVLIQQLLERYHPMVIRFFLINSHYRKSVDFNEDALEQSQTLVNRIVETIKRLDDSPGGAATTLLEEMDKLEEEFINAMDDDLNTVAAIHAIMRFVKKVNALLDNEKVHLEAASEKITQLMGILGITTDLLNVNETKGSNLINPLVEQLIDIRAELRKMKRFELADKIRAELNELGIVLKDGKKGTSWKKG